MRPIAGQRATETEVRERGKIGPIVEFFSNHVGGFDPEFTEQGSGFVHIEDTGVGKDVAVAIPHPDATKLETARGSVGQAGNGERGVDIRQPFQSPSHIRRIHHGGVHGEFPYREAVQEPVAHQTEFDLRFALRQGDGIEFEKPLILIDLT